MSSFCKCKSYSHFFSKSISVYALFNDQSFNDTLTNNIVALNNWALDTPLFYFKRQTKCFNFTICIYRYSTSFLMGNLHFSLGKIHIIKENVQEIVLKLYMTEAIHVLTRMQVLLTLIYMILKASFSNNIYAQFKL